MQIAEEVKEHRILMAATAAVIAAALVAVIALQLYTIPEAKECLFQKAAAKEGGITGLAKCFRPITLWPALLLMQSVMLLIAAEIIYKAPSTLFAKVFNSDKRTLIALAVAVAALTTFYPARGDVLLGDAYLFQPAAAIFKSAMSEGIPHHTFYWYGGSSHFEYYGQLYFAAVAAADYVTNNINAAIKIVNWLLHIIAAVALYFFAFELTKSRKASFIAAIAYSVSYEHIARVMLHGRLTSAVTYLLLPLLLLLIERAVKRKTSPTTATAGISLSAAAIFLNNPAEGVFALIPAAAYYFIRTWQQPSKQDKIRCLKIGAAAALLFLIMTSFWTLPFVLEKPGFNAGARVEELTSISFRPEVLKGLVSFPGQKGIATAYYVGIVQLALAAVALWAVLGRKKVKVFAPSTSAQLAAAGITGAATLLLMVLQSPRYSVALVLLLATLAGAGAGAGGAQLIIGRIGRERLLLILAALLVADSTAAIFQPYYPDFSTEKNNISAQIPAETGFRTIDLHSDRRTFYPSLTYLATGTESVFGSLLEGAPKSTNYAIAVATRAAKEHYDDRAEFSNYTLDGLYLFNVRYVVLHPEQEQEGRSRNVRVALGLENDLAVIALPNSPAIAAPKAEQYSNYELEQVENYFLRTKFEERTVNYRITDEIMNRMKLNRETATAETILLKDAPKEKPPQLDRNGSLTITAAAAVETKHSKVRLAVEQSSDALLQLSYSASPEISVFVDGKKTAYYTTAINTIAVKTGKGKHTIEIVASPSKLRQVLFAISAAVAAVAAIAIIIAKLFESRRQKAEGAKFLSAPED